MGLHEKNCVFAHGLCYNHSVFLQKEMRKEEAMTNWFLQKPEKPVDIYLAPTYDECIDFLKNAVRYAETHGQKTVIFCEDKLTLEAERAVASEMRVVFDTEITTFRRFIERTENLHLISKEGSVLAIARIMTENKEDLRCFNGAHSVLTAAEKIFETISLFEASGVEPEDIAPQKLAMEGGTLLLDKMFDLYYIYLAYRDFLQKNHFADAESYMTLFASAAEKSEFLHGANVIFCANTSLRRRSAEGIRAVCALASKVRCVFVGSTQEDGFYTNRALNRFLKICEEDFDETLRTTRVRIDCRIHSLAFSGGKEASVLLSSMFRPSVFGAKQGAPCPDVHMLECADEEEEVVFAAVTIRRLVAEGARYKDIAVLVPSVGHYNAEIKRLFGEYDIPYFCDVKRELSAHPLTRFVAACLAACLDGFSPRSTQKLVSDFCFYTDERDVYSNYLFRTANRRGGALAKLEEESIPEGYEAAFAEMHARILCIAQSLPGKATPLAYCKRIQQLIADLDLKSAMALLAKEYADGGMTEESSFIEQGTERFFEILEEFVSYMGEAEIALSEFKDAFLSAAASSKISVIPLKLDAVFIGDIGGTAKRAAPVLFALGLTSAVPAVKEDVMLLSDRDLAFLKKKIDKVSMCIEPTLCQENDMAREVFAVNLAGFANTLYASCPAVYDGQESVPGEGFRYIRKVFSATPVRFTEWSRSDEFRRYSVWQEKTEPKERAKYIASGCELLLGKKVGEEKVVYVSPSMLEKFFACPYGNYAERGLKLEERKTRAVQANDEGNFIHAVLYGASDCMRQEEDVLEKKAEACADELLAKPPYAYLTNGSGADRYKAERLKREAVGCCKKVRASLLTGKFEIREKEAVIGDGEDAAYPSIRLTDDVRLYGIVDRVDGWQEKAKEAVRIVDYKTGHVTPGCKAYYTGRKMQLELYMNAVAEGKRPAGMEYMRISEQIESDTARSRFRQGFADDDPELLTASGAEVKVRSNSVEAASRMNREDFGYFIRYSLCASRQGIAEICDGYIEPTPFSDGGSTCDYCKYGTMCGNEGESLRTVEGQVSCKDIADVVRMAEQVSKDEEEEENGGE